MATTIFFGTGKTAYQLTVQGKAEENFQGLENAQQVIIALNQLRELLTIEKHLQETIVSYGHVLEDLEDDDPLVKMLNEQVTQSKETMAKYGFSEGDNINMSKVPIRYLVS